jgi:hypothetical protein
MPEREVSKPLGTSPKYLYFPGFNLNTERISLRTPLMRCVPTRERTSLTGSLCNRSAIGLEFLQPVRPSMTLSERCASSVTMTVLNASGYGCSDRPLVSIDAEIVRQFARGLTDIIVVEEKRDFSSDRSVASSATWAR